MEIAETSGKNCFDEKVREKWNYFSNVLENVDIASFISMFCQQMRVINFFIEYVCSFVWGLTLL